MRRSHTLRSSLQEEGEGAARGRRGGDPHTMSMKSRTPAEVFEAEHVKVTKRMEALGVRGSEQELRSALPSPPAAQAQPAGAVRAHARAARGGQGGERPRLLARRANAHHSLARAQFASTSSSRR